MPRSFDLQLIGREKPEQASLDTRAIGLRKRVREAYRGGAARDCVGELNAVI
jgi:hypothetical protein